MHFQHTFQIMKNNIMKSRQQYTCFMEITVLNLMIFISYDNELQFWIRIGNTASSSDGGCARCISDIFLFLLSRHYSPMWILVSSKVNFHHPIYLIFRSLHQLCHLNLTNPSEHHRVILSPIIITLVLDSQWQGRYN